MLLTDITTEKLREGQMRARQQQRRFGIRIDGMTAHAKIKSAEQFIGLLRMLRQNAHFAPAVVELEKLQAELKRRRGVGLPVPEDVWQRPDPALVVAWGGVSAIAYQGGIASLVGGTGGTPMKGLTEDLLNALAMKARMQACG